MSEAAKSRRSGVERAAILLLTLGESEAAEILKHMGAKDVQRLGRAMAELTSVSRDEVRSVLGDVHHAVESQTSLGVGGDEFVRKVLVSALGEEKAASAHRSHPSRRPAQGPRGAQVDGCARGGRADPQRTSADHRHRACRTSIPTRRPKCWRFLPEPCAPIWSCASPRSTAFSPRRCSELDDMMEKQFAAGAGDGKSSSLGGLKVAADMVNLLDSTVGQHAHDRHRQDRRTSVAEASRT